MHHSVAINVQMNEYNTNNIADNSDLNVLFCLIS